MFGNIRHPLLHEAAVIILIVEGLSVLLVFVMASTVRLSQLVLFIPAFLFIPGYCCIALSRYYQSYTIIERTTIVVLTSIALNVLVLDILEKYYAPVTPARIMMAIVGTNIVAVIFFLITMFVRRFRGT